MSAGQAASPVFVGNDVVDLANPRTEGRATDERFVARVFDPVERAAIDAEGGSDIELWSRWAAKEAAFKAISKLIGTQPAFLHRTFKVVWVGTPDAVTGEAPRDEADESVVRRGSVLHGDHVAQVTVRLRPGAVHAVALCSPSGLSTAAELHRRVARLDDVESCWSGPLEELMGRFSAREADAVRSRESAAVRLGAREDLAKMLGVAEERVEIVCDPGPSTRRPPRVLLDGRAARVDLSLSHDGRWIAWAIWMDT